METSRTLRDQLAPLIHDALSGIDKANICEIRRSLKKAYPFDSTRGYGYFVWLNEVHQQLGFKLKRSRKHKDQMELFD